MTDKDEHNLEWEPSMNKVCAVFALVFFVAGCATANKTYAPDGREAYSIDCSGSARTWAQCVEKAGSLCGAHGYDIYDRTAEGGWVAGSYGTANRSSATAGGFGSSTNARTLLISCKKAD